MFKRLIVPMDGTPQAAVALPLARTMAQRTGAGLVLVRLVPGYALDPPRTGVALDYLERVARKLDVPVRLVVARGDDVAAELIFKAKLHDADLIVMATHGRAGLRRAIAGSVADRAIARSPVPVLVLRPGARRGRTFSRLLVPVDGSLLQGWALYAACALARTFSMHVDVLRVVPPRSALVTRFFGQNNDQARQAAWASVHQLVSAFRHAGIECDEHVAVGHVAEAISATADEVGTDLVVMATHGRTGVARAVRGSVADQVIRTVQAPVLLLRGRLDGGRARAGSDPWPKAVSANPSTLHGS
jgi:nucleotide-binding universal stress UspA family protein